MINIAKKKLPFPAVAVILYISYCAMSWYAMRGTLAYYGEQSETFRFFANDAWAFFIGGLLPFLIYYLASMFVFKTMHVRTGGGDVKSLRYGLDLTVIAANVLLFALKFMYFAVPLQSGLLDIILDPTVTIAAVALYLLYAYKMKYVDKSRFHAALTIIMGAFLLVYGLLAAVGLITIFA